jgi:hypothetical protein
VVGIATAAGTAKANARATTVASQGLFIGVVS